MMSVCLRYTNDEHTAQDILQVGFIKVFDIIYQYRNEGSFEGWMRRIFVSTAIRQLKKKKINFYEIQEERQDEPFEDAQVVSKISEDELHRLIRTLPEGYRVVFNMVVIEGYTHEETASLLKIKPATSRTQLLKARKMLQGLIASCFNMVII